VTPKETDESFYRQDYYSKFYVCLVEGNLPEDDVEKMETRSSFDVSCLKIYIKLTCTAVFGVISALFINVWM
jgi:hypothetical protein